MTPTASIDTEKCPITGMPLIRRREWTDMDLDDTYRATIFLLGDRIIVGRPSGYATMKAMRKVIEVSGRIIDEHLAPDKPYLHIQDYTHLTGANLKARKYFIDEMKKRTRTRAIIFCGQRPFGRIAFALAARIHNFPCEMIMKRDYPQAALAARNILMAEDGLSHADGEVPAAGAATQDPEWEFATAACSVKMEVMGGSILHSRLVGHFEESHAEKLGSLRKKVLDTIDPAVPAWFLADMSGVRGISRRARKATQAQFFDLSTQRKLGGVYIYGANAIVRASVHLGRPYAGVKTSLAHDVRGAMDLLQADRARLAGGDADGTMNGPVSEGGTASLARHNVEEVLAYLSAQNWDREGEANTPPVSADHPFRPVFESLDLIKRDLDELFKEHRLNVDELRKTRDGLWNRIAERTADLSAANERLRETDLQRSRQAAELNANLGRILDDISSSVDTMEKDGDPEDEHARVRSSLAAARKVMEQFCQQVLGGGSVEGRAETCAWPPRKGDG